MKKEIRNTSLDTRSESVVDKSLFGDTSITHVNGHYLPDEDDEDEDDLVLGDEAAIDDVDYNEDIEVELDDELDEDELDDDDLVLDADDDEEDEDDRI